MGNVRSLLTLTTVRVPVELLNQQEENRAAAFQTAHSANLSVNIYCQMMNLLN